MDKIRDIGEYVRNRFPGVGNIEISVLAIIELIEVVYKSRDEEIKKEINTQIKQCALTCENLWIDNFSGVGEQYQCAEAIMKRIKK